MNWTLEVVVVPVADVDRAKKFYAEKLGFNLEPGSLRGVQLCVADLAAAREQLTERGVEAGEIQVFAEGGPRPYPDGDALDMVGFVFFSDPDGNGWAVQQMPGRR